MQVLLGSLMQLQVTKTPAGYANMAAKDKKLTTHVLQFGAYLFA